LELEWAAPFDDIDCTTVKGGGNESYIRRLPGDISFELNIARNDAK
jgi:hypothetical protein